MSGAELTRRAMMTASAAAMFAPPLLARTGGEVRTFKGIRYGRARRFEAPVALLDNRIALADFGPACPQRGDRYRPQSEDCLFLTLWTPSVEGKAKRPVMVYFQGGAYSTGSVTDPVNDGAALAARGDVVVVTVNHRLNALGYLYLAGLDPRFPTVATRGSST